MNIKDLQSQQCQEKLLKYLLSLTAIQGVVRLLVQWSVSETP